MATHGGRAGCDPFCGGSRDGPPDNAALSQSVTPTNFSGALVYPSTAVATGFMLVGEPAGRVPILRAPGPPHRDGLQREDRLLEPSPRPSSSGYGVGITSCFVPKVDVVSP